MGATRVAVSNRECSRPSATICRRECHRYRAACTCRNRRGTVICLGEIAGRNNAGHIQHRATRIREHHALWRACRADIDIAEREISG